MPSPAIKYPPGVSVSRDGAVTYKRPAAGGKPAQDFGVVGHVRPTGRDMAQGGDAVGWTAHYADGARLPQNSSRAVLEPFKGQREAVRAVLQAQGFWPAEVRPEPKYPQHEARSQVDSKLVRPGDKVHNFRGESGVYEMISRLPEPEEGKTGKVIVNGREFYAKVWGIEIAEVPHA